MQGPILCGRADRHKGLGQVVPGARPDWDILAGPRAPEEAPNVLVVLLDDAGFGQPSTFGGPVSTPSLSRLADPKRRPPRLHWKETTV